MGNFVKYSFCLFTRHDFRRNSYLCVDPIRQGTRRDGEIEAIITAEAAKRRLSPQQIQVIRLLEDTLQPKRAGEAGAGRKESDSSERPIRRIWRCRRNV